MSKIYSICPVLMERCKKSKSENPPAEGVGGIYAGPGQKIHPPAEGVGGLGEHQKQARKFPPAEGVGGMIRKASKDPPEQKEKGGRPEVSNKSDR